MKNKRKAAYVPQIDVDKLMAPYERQWLERELDETRAKLIESERKRTEEKKAAQKERDEIMGFVGLVAGLVILAGCALSSAPWTALFIFLGIVAIMRKVGWL